MGKTESLFWAQFLGAVQMGIGKQPEYAGFYIMVDGVKLELGLQSFSKISFSQVEVEDSRQITNTRTPSQQFAWSVAEPISK